jgi:hypothetical protein
MEWLWRWIGNRLARMAPEWIVTDEGVTVIQRERVREEVRWEDLVRVEIVTTDRGPWDDDLFYVLTSREGRDLVVPSEAPQSAEVLVRLQRLPGFDNQAVIESAGCTENRRFLCWEKPGFQVSEADGSLE